jgi:hypothetical protein
VIVVDDGIATGYTFRAALERVRRLHPARLIAAVPVGPPESVAALDALADDVVCLAMPEPFWAVGVWYADFSPTTDEEAIAILHRHWSQHKEGNAVQARRLTMTTQTCPRHHVAMELVPAEPHARCLSCGYTTHHLAFDQCRECGSRMHIEEPEPHWRCPVCHPVREPRSVAATG